MAVVIVIISLIIIWSIMIMPHAKCRRARSFAGTAFAHRGLHDEARSENSLAAFENACGNGCGIELDVQFTRDETLVVFHDDDAVRMTGKKALVRDMTLAEIKKLRLTDGSEIPTLAEVLDTVNGRVPLLVEIKSCQNIGRLTRATADMLRTYSGRYVVESFNPFCLAVLRKHAPEMIRGQLVTGRKNYKDQSGVVAFALSHLMLNFIGRPDFIAYDHTSPDNPSLFMHKKVFKTPLASWTTTDVGLYSEQLQRGEIPIFENFVP